MKASQIYAIPPDKGGWRRLQNGNYVKLGDGVKLGGHVKLSDGVRLGNNVTLGDDVKLGNSAIVGDEAILGDGVRLGNYVVLGNSVILGDNVKLGDGVRLGGGVRLSEDVILGSHVRLGDGMTSKHLNLDGIERYRVAGKSHVFEKWVTKDRKSPNFDGGTVLNYEKGSVVTAEGEVSDQQRAPGLHVLRVGVRPEYVGMCRADHDYIPLIVRVKSDDILHAGMPGNDAMLRIRMLEVLT